MILTKEHFEKLKPCRVTSSAGDCLTNYRFVKENVKSITVAFVNGSQFETETVHKKAVHFEHCPGCPNGI